MPLTGADLLAAGLVTGPMVGKALKSAEEAWISSDFSLGREELLRLV
jgi:poly(A) polymerase